MSRQIAKTWLVPLATITVFFFLLAYKIPYAAGYGWDKVPLGNFLRGMWRISDEWKHGMVVPFICLFLIYLQRKQLLQAPIRGNMKWGAGLLALGVILYCLGLRAQTEYFGFAAIQIFIVALILWFWGWRVFCVLLFPWLFFVFTWPLPFLDSVVALPLRLIMSHVSYDLLNLFGTPTLQSGTAVLSAPDMQAGLRMGQKFQIDIADPCSGLHSLFALLMISALAAYLSIRSVPLRWLVFLTAIPLAVAGNVVRILFLVWGTEYLGSPVAIGTEENPSAYHMGCGYAVYLVALGLLFALISFFNSPRVVSRLPAFLRARPAPEKPEPAL
jgi:exosortase